MECKFQIQKETNNNIIVSFSFRSFCHDFQFSAEQPKYTQIHFLHPIQIQNTVRHPTHPITLYTQSTSNDMRYNRNGTNQTDD